MDRRSIEISLGRPLIAVVVVLVGGTLAYVTATLGHIAVPWTVRPTPTSLSAPESDPADVARRIAIAMNAVDYRDPDGWLASLRPLSSDRGFLMLQTLYVPMSWALFERDQRVTQPDQVIAEDRGVIAEGPGWQVRLVVVTIADDEVEPDAFEMRFALGQESDAWKFTSLLTQAEVDALLAQRGRDGR